MNDLSPSPHTPDKNQPDPLPAAVRPQPNGPTGHMRMAFQHDIITQLADLLESMVALCFVAIVLVVICCVAGFLLDLFG